MCVLCEPLFSAEVNVIKLAVFPTNNKHTNSVLRNLEESSPFQMKKRRSLGCVILPMFYSLGTVDGCSKPWVDGNRIGNLRITSEATLLAGQILESDFYHYEDPPVYNTAIDLATECTQIWEPDLRVTILGPLEENITRSSADCEGDTWVSPCS